MSGMDVLRVVSGPRERVVFSSPLQPDVAAERVREALLISAHPSSGPLVKGWVRNARLLLTLRHPGRRNAWAPTVHGQLESGPSGSSFSGVVGPYPLVEVFLGVWSGIACAGVLVGVLVAAVNLPAGHYGMAGRGALVVAAGIACLGVLVGMSVIGARLSRGEADTLKFVLAEALSTDERP